VHPDDISKHPAFKDISSSTKSAKEQEEAVKSNLSLSQTEGVGVYYLSKFRGVHNHPLDWNLMDPNSELEMLKKRVVGRAIQFNENCMMTGSYLQAAREGILEGKEKDAKHYDFK